jgi:hypothetical protein
VCSLAQTIARVACVLAIVAVATPAHAQNTPTHAYVPRPADVQAVRRAALDYVEGFYEGDSTKHLRSIRPEVYKFGFWRPADSTSFQPGEQMTWPAFFNYTRRVRETGRRTPATAVKQVTIYEVLDQTASAKVTASWGVDYLLLGKFDGRWMITHALWQSPPRAAH